MNKKTLDHVTKSVIPDFPGRNGVILVGGQRGQDRKELLSFLILKEPLEKGKS